MPMKNAIVAVAATLALAACQQKDEVADADPGTTNPAINAAQDAVGAAVGATTASTVAPMTTDSFATNAVIGGMYEIQAGQIAEKKSQNAAVKSFAKMMVADHTAMSNQMKPLIAAAGVTAPTGLDERRKGMIDNLNAASAADFDGVYRAQQDAAHKETLALMEGYAQSGDNAGLKDAAAKAVPKVRAHLDHVQQLASAATAAGR